MIPCKQAFPNMIGCWNNEMEAGTTKLYCHRKIRFQIYNDQTKHRLLRSIQNSPQHKNS